MLSATLFPAPFLLMFCFLNTVAIAYNSQAALPFGTIVVIMLIWALVTLPLTVVGGIIGRNTAKGRPVSVPTRVNKIPREIPAIPWYRQGARKARRPLALVKGRRAERLGAVWGNRHARWREAAAHVQH